MHRCGRGDDGVIVVASLSDSACKASWCLAVEHTHSHLAGEAAAFPGGAASCPAWKAGRPSPQQQATPTTVTTLGWHEQLASPTTDGEDSHTTLSRALLFVSATHERATACATAHVHTQHCSSYSPALLVGIDHIVARPLNNTTDWHTSLNFQKEKSLICERNESL